MTTGANSATRGAVQPVRTRGLQVGMILALVLGCVVDLLIQTAISRKDPGRLVYFGLLDSVLPYVFFLIPYLAALVLVAGRKHRVLVASGAGLAFTLFGAFLLASRRITMMVFLWAGLSGEKSLFVALGLVVLLILSSIWIVGCALWQMKNSVAAFIISASIAGTYFYVGFPALQLREYRAEQHKEQVRVAQSYIFWQASDAARRDLESLTACLIEYRDSQPDGNFPASLAELPQNLQVPKGLSCKPSLAMPGAVTDYTITYTPQKNPTTGKLTDFRLLAMPIRKGMEYVNPMLIDSRGRVFVYERWFGTEQGEHLEPLLTQEPDDLQTSRLLLLHAIIEFAMKKKNVEQPPSSLSQLQLPLQATEITNVADTVKEGTYIVKYLSPNAEDPTRFAMSAICQSYGNACIRSFFLDSDNQVHQTIEPRPATAQDPLIPECEKYGQTCRDIDWPVP